MIFTRSILSEFLNLEHIVGDEICKSLNDIGFEVESFQKIHLPCEVVVGQIISCNKHPNADKLSICQVAIGGSEGAYEMSQIVCGATNVQAGLLVAVAKEGAKLPNLTIKKTTLRGVESCGMLCSSTELGLPKINDGLLVLDESIGQLEIGRPLCDYQIFCDEVYEISITPNRGDCHCILGIAQEIKAAFSLEELKLPSLKEDDNAPGIGRVLQVHCHAKESSLLYRAFEASFVPLSLKHLVFLAYNNELSDYWLQNLISLSMLYTGVLINVYPQSFCQPLKGEVERVVLTIKKDEQGFESVYLDEKKLSVIGIDNCIGEIGCEHNHANEFIIVEASYIPPEVIAKKVFDKKLKITSNVFARSSKGSNPNLSLGLDFLGNLFLQNSHTIVYTDKHEILQCIKRDSITIEVEKVSQILGIPCNRSQIVTILKSLAFEVEIAGDDSYLSITPPLFRHDIATVQDIAEEVIRFIRLDNIPSVPLCFVQQNPISNQRNIYHFKRAIAKKAIAAGFCEVIHFIFASQEKLQKYGFETLKEPYSLLNPITNDLNTLRTTMALSLLEAVHKNKNNGLGCLSLVEVGSVYDKTRKEYSKIAFIQSGLLIKEHYPKPKGQQSDFFDFADRVCGVVGHFELFAIQKDQQRAGMEFFHPYQCAIIWQNNKAIGILGALHPRVLLEYDLEPTYFCEIDLGLLEASKPQVHEYSKFQKNIRDLSVVVDAHLPYWKIKQSIEKLKIAEVVLFYPLDIYEDAKLEDKISLTIRFELQSLAKTLEEKEITSILDQILSILAKDHKAVLR